MSFVQEAEQQLSVLKADEGLTVAQLDSWPKHRLDVLREAAGLFQELNYLSVKYQKWMLQQVHLSINLSFPLFFLTKLHSRRKSKRVPVAVNCAAFDIKCRVHQQRKIVLHCRGTALLIYQIELLCFASGHMS